MTVRTGLLLLEEVLDVEEELRDEVVKARLVGGTAVRTS